MAAMIVFVLSLVLAACGGDSSKAGVDFPVFAGAERVDSAKLSTEDMPIDAKGAGSVVYTSSASYADVAAYYESGITAEGWDVANSPGSLPDTVSIQSISKDDSVALVTVMSTDFAREESSASMFDAADVEVDESDLEGANAVVVILHFTCEEDDITACVSAMTGE
jgi:hypothetical protein